MWCPGEVSETSGEGSGGKFGVSSLQAGTPSHPAWCSSSLPSPGLRAIVAALPPSGTAPKCMAVPSGSQYGE